MGVVADVAGRLGLRSGSDGRWEAIRRKRTERETRGGWRVIATMVAGLAHGAVDDAI